MPSGCSWNWSAVCRLLPRIKVEKLDVPHHIHCILLKRDKQLSHWKTDVNTTWHLVKGQILPVINNNTLHCTFYLSTHMYSTECVLFSEAPLLWVAGCMCGWMSLRMLDLTRGEFGSIGYHLLENQIKYRVKRKLKNSEQNPLCLFSRPTPPARFFPGCTFPDYEFIPVVFTPRLCLGYAALSDKYLHCQTADPLWRLRAVTLSGLYFTSNKSAFTWMQPIALTAHLYINIIPSAFHSWRNTASKVAGGEEGVSRSSGSKLKPCSSTPFFSIF